jgi:hypothetical protein
MRGRYIASWADEHAHWFRAPTNGRQFGRIARIEDVRWKFVRGYRRQAASEAGAQGLVHGLGRQRRVLDGDVGPPAAGHEAAKRHLAPLGAMARLSVAKVA